MIYVPIYEVSVYDSVSGSLICHHGISGNLGVESCDISFEYSEDGQAADISVSLPGYATETLHTVKNQTWRTGCWDNPEYTTSVDIDLTPD
jgi:hypothetical protein